jgi:hypothetical protein
MKSPVPGADVQMSRRDDRICADATGRLGTVRDHQIEILKSESFV